MSTAMLERVSLAVARRLADKVTAELSPACHRIEVAGSVRRGKASIGDIDLMIVPRAAGLFDGGGESLDDVLARIVAEGRLCVREYGERKKSFTVNPQGAPARTVGLDLWLCDPEQWGVMLAIRTGEQAFSQSLVTEVSRGGRLRDGLIVREGRVWQRGEVITGMIDYRGKGGRREGRPFFTPLPGALPLETPEESDFLALAGGWVPPEQRI